jgi:hypothetical protein
VIVAYYRLQGVDLDGNECVSEWLTYGQIAQALANWLAGGCVNVRVVQMRSGARVGMEARS